MFFTSFHDKRHQKSDIVCIVNEITFWHRLHHCSPFPKHEITLPNTFHTACYAFNQELSNKSPRGYYVAKKETCTESREVGYIITYSELIGFMFLEDTSG
jgi:hypothetical protein